MLRATPTEGLLLNPITGGSGASNHHFLRNVLAFVIFLLYWWLHRQRDNFTTQVDHPFILGSPLLTMSVDVAWFELLTYGVSCNQDTSFVPSTLAFTWFSVKFVFYPQTIFTEKKRKGKERERKDANICITEEDQTEEPSYS